jgi:small-conductance mechanosensitive channel
MTARWLGLVAVTYCTSAYGLNAGLGDAPPEIDRSTAAATVGGFLTLAHDGNYQLAAHYLDLDQIQVKEQPAEGARLARRLRFVLDHKLWLDFTKINHESGDSPRPRYEDLGSLPLGHTNQPIRLRRYDLPKGQVWLFSAPTVRAIDPLYQVYGPPFVERLPEFFFQHSFMDLELWQWLGLLISIVVSGIFAWLVTRFASALGMALSRLKAWRWTQELPNSQPTPLQLLIWALLMDLAVHLLVLPQPALGDIDIVARSVVIGCFAWLALRALAAVVSALDQAASQPDGVQQVGMRTQLRLLRQILSFVIFVVSGALILMQFSTVRHVGISLLASAGIGGVVLGLAAQKSISTLFAGIQLSVTQPIRIGDTVVVESESGIIEEITLTYVIVKLWDLRRLIIPMTYFLEKPFQNWNKGTGETLETVVLHTSRSADVDAFRSELDRLLSKEGKGLWDGRIHDIITTEAANQTLLLRVVVTSTDPASAWRLRAVVRDRLSLFLYQHPDWLPHLDINLPRMPGETAAAPKH